MICLEISINGSQFCRAGIERAILLSLTLGISVGSEDGAMLSISGMSELAVGRDAHVNWPTKNNLSPGDVIQFTMVDADDPTKPSEVIATDSPKYLEEQREFEEFDKTYVRPTTPAKRRWPTLGFRCTVDGTQVADAVMAPHEEHILCSVS